MDAAVQRKENDKAAKTVVRLAPEPKASEEAETGMSVGLPLYLQSAQPSAGSAPPSASRPTAQIQRQVEDTQEEEELLQPKHNDAVVQRQVEGEEEELLQPTRINSPAVQTKISVGPPDDEYEREADQVADKVMRMPAAQTDSVIAGQQQQDLIQPKPLTPLYLQRLCEECEEELPQGNSTSSTAAVQTKSQSEASSNSSHKLNQAVATPGNGSPLPQQVQSRIGQVLNNDLSHVRVHSDNQAQEAAQAINAKAFTHRNHIYLGGGQSVMDVQLMAHEATHVAQQSGLSDSSIQRDPADAGPRTADISVRWTEDSQEFYHRVINSASRNRGFRGVRRASLYQPFHSLSAAMHSRLGRRTPIMPPGTPIQLRVTLWFDPSAFHGQVSNPGLEQLEVALLRDNRVTGVLTPAAALPSGSPNRLGIMEAATLSFTSNPPATAAAFGGLRWHVASGSATLTGGTDGRANLTTDSSPGNISLELRVERGPTAGRVATTLNLEVVDWPLVGGRPGSPEQATAGLLDVTGGALQHSGNVSASPGSTAGEVTVTAPNVTFNATVSLKPTATLAPGTSIQVGPVQTTMSSERIGIYREGGNPRGNIVAERRITAPRSRDAQYRDTPTGPVPDVAAPWYSRPSGAVTGPPSITAATPSQPVTYRDQPSFDLPMSVGNGILTETRGSESFITSIVALHNGNQVHLKSTTWSIPWNLSIAAGGTATGGAIGSSEIRFGAPVTSGPFTIGSTQDVLVFSSVADAAAAPAAMLLAHLESTRRHDPAAGRILAEGLRSKNPSFNVNITVVRGADLIPPEDFDVQASGHTSVTRPGFSVANGASASITLPFNALFNPHRLGSGDALTLSLLDVGSPIPTMSWAFPFNDATTPSRFTSGNGGHYTITGNLR